MVGARAPSAAPSRLRPSAGGDPDAREGDERGAANDEEALNFWRSPGRLGESGRDGRDDAVRGLIAAIRPAVPSNQGRSTPVRFEQSHRWTCVLERRNEGSRVSVIVLPRPVGDIRAQAGVSL